MSPSRGLGREPQPGSGAGAPAGCGAEPREENFDNQGLKTPILARPGPHNETLRDLSQFTVFNYNYLTRPQGVLAAVQQDGTLLSRWDLPKLLCWLGAVPVSGEEDVTDVLDCRCCC